MISIQENVSLKPYSTFMVSAFARYFIDIEHEADIEELVESDLWDQVDHLVIGQGSNILFANEQINKLIIHNIIKGLEIIEDTSDYITVRVGSGYNWHELVLWASQQGLWGIENLVLIPGNVGACPVQNIGAYGQEVSDTIVRVRAYDTEAKIWKEFSTDDCCFGYRHSVFKDYPGRYIIAAVDFQLLKKGTAQTQYGAIVEKLNNHNITVPTPQDMNDVVTEIRRSKLPDVGTIGTAGSFFKNPIVSQSQHEDLSRRYPDIPFFQVDSDYKIPAAWLIEQCDLKGYRDGDAGVYEKHALVLVNYGDATGSQMLNLVHYIIDNVFKKFEITLEPEVNLVR